MGQVTAYYKEECARYGWQPEPHHIIYRANILIAETGEKAQQASAQYPREAVFRLKDRVAATLLEVDQRNVAGEGRRPVNVNRALPINFCGGPDEIVAQLKEARGQIGCGVVDLSFQTPGSEDPDELMEALELLARRCCRTSATSKNKRSGKWQPDSARNRARQRNRRGDIFTAPEHCR
jgi:alkanesulfonate monooxygenase SsuD/methylene tetrahydromethanopterin reductase-like flavin-dependent oxidoreductase (luciferase family)